MNVKKKKISKIYGLNIKKKVISIFLSVYIYMKIFYFYNYNLEKPKISIFLAIYNKELYIKNCIRSFQRQTFKNLEIIAVNDGSTDNSLTILKKLSKKDNRIKIFNNDRNHGLLYSRAMGIINSTGEYLMSVDPDDKLINKNDLEILYKMSNLKKPDTIIYLIKRIAENKSDIEYFKYLEKNQLKMMDDHITNKFVKKNIFIKAYNEFKNEIFNGVWNFHEDNIWSYLVRKNSNSILILNKYIYYYKRNKDSLNLKMGDEIDLKNRYYRYKKFKQMNYNNSIEYSLKRSLGDTKKFTQFLKNREIRTNILHILVDFLKLYLNTTLIYKNINKVINKIAKNKMIIFYESSKNQYINRICLLNFFKLMNIKNKPIISFNIHDKFIIDYIKNYTYSNDLIILLDNFNESEIKLLFDLYKYKNVIRFIYGKNDSNRIFNHKKLNFYICSYI